MNTDGHDEKETANALETAWAAGSQGSTAVSAIGGVRTWFIGKTLR
jgi:hypothetical protein